MCLEAKTWIKNKFIRRQYSSNILSISNPRHRGMMGVSLYILADTMLVGRDWAARIGSAEYFYTDVQCAQWIRSIIWNRRSNGAICEQRAER